MVIANLMASVLALAMVGASTASVSKVENVSAGSDVVSDVDVHKAYYDPAGTYGTTNGQVYNYSSESFYEWTDDPDDPTSDGILSTYLIEKEHSRYYQTDFWNGKLSIICFSGADSGELGYRFGLSGGVHDKEFSVYIDGEYVADISSYQDTTASHVTANLYKLEFAYDSDINYSEHYLWVFDAGSAPADPYTGVDMLGDIAEGLTGGIVPVAEGIGSGLQSLVQDIFLNASHDGLSVFGIVIVCFAGLALALGLSRWVLNFVDTLGARDR